MYGVREMSICQGAEGSAHVWVRRDDHMSKGGGMGTCLRRFSK